MTTIRSALPARLSVGDLTLEVVGRGAGRPVLLLHGPQNVDPRARFLDLLGILFAGSPHTVYRQIMEFSDKVGPFGHLVMVGRSGFMTHAEAEKGIRLFAREVLPRLKEIAPVTVG